MTSNILVSGSAGDMIQQLAASARMDNIPDDPTLSSEIATIVDSVPGLAALSEADRRAATGALMVDIMWGDPDNEAVPGGPHIVRRRAEWVLTAAGRAPLADPQAVSDALHATADALELADLMRGKR